MQLARVIGTVVATVKAPGLEGVKLLVIQPLDRHQAPVGSQLVAADAVHMAGRGELVYFVAAREAAQAMPDPFVPVDHAIVGIVDAVRLLDPSASAARPVEPEPRPSDPTPESPPAPPRRRTPARRSRP